MILTLATLRQPPHRLGQVNGSVVVRPADDRAGQVFLAQLGQLIRGRHWWNAAELAQVLITQLGEQPFLAQTLEQAVLNLGLSPIPTSEEMHPVRVFQRNIDAIDAAELLDPTVHAKLVCAASSLFEQHIALRPRGSSHIVFAPRIDRDDLAPPHRWLALRDEPAFAQRAATGFPSNPSDFLPPIVLIGTASGHGLKDVHTRIVRDAQELNLFKRRIIVIEPELSRMARALATTDLRGILSEKCCTIYTGPTALKDFQHFLDDTHHLAMPCQILRLDLTGQGQQTVATVSAAINAATEQQRAKINATVVDVTAYYGHRTPASIANIFSSQLPLSILICTSRHSTFVKHAAADLSSALASLGHTVHMHIEPDHSSLFAAGAVTLAIDTHHPDVLISLNYPRATLESSNIPKQLPVACWIQDAMPHLYSSAVANAQEPHDVLFGYCFTQLFDHHSFEPRAALPASIPASTTKFFDDPPPPADLLDAYRCDIAFISNHGEPPELLRDRLISQVNQGDRGIKLVRELFECATRLANRAHTACTHIEIESIVESSFRAAFGHMPSRKDLDQIRTAIFMPFLGRIFRHQAVKWAAELADQHNLTLRLFGKHWDRSPFARFAQGVLEHGEPLRGAYAAATLTLQLDPLNAIHQRVAECALSGGLPAPRFFQEMLNRLRIHAASDAISLERLNAITSALPQPTDQFLKSPNTTHTDRFPAHQLITYDASMLYPELDQLTFWDKPSLEKLITRAGDPQWRAARIADMQSSVKAHFTYDALATRLIEHLRARTGALAT